MHFTADCPEIKTELDTQLLVKTFLANLRLTVSPRVMGKNNSDLHSWLCLGWFFEDFGLLAT